MSIKHKNGRLELNPSSKLGGIQNAVLEDEAVNLSQLNTVANNSDFVDITVSNIATVSRADIDILNVNQESDFIGLMYSEQGIIHNHILSTLVESTRALTGAEMALGLIITTSAAPTTLTTPTATEIADQFTNTGATYFDFIIDNSGGSNTVTLSLDSSITVMPVTITGSNNLLVTTTNKFGMFRLYFAQSGTAYCARIL